MVSMHNLFENIIRYTNEYYSSVKARYPLLAVLFAS